MDIREHVEYLLKNYHEIKRNVEILYFEIERFAGIDYDDVIESMNYSKPEGERVSTSNISDKTAKIALAFREITDNRNKDTLRDMVKRYYEVKDEIDLIEYCVANLEKRLSEIMRDMFFNRYSWTKLCNKYYVSVAMIGKYRKKAISEIIKMYEIRQSVIN